MALIDTQYSFYCFYNLQVKVPLYGCDCYAYALLASGFVDLVIESGLKVSCFHFHLTLLIFLRHYQHIWQWLYLCSRHGQINVPRYSNIGN